MFQIRICNVASFLVAFGPLIGDASIVQSRLPTEAFGLSTSTNSQSASFLKNSRQLSHTRLIMDIYGTICSLLVGPYRQNFAYSSVQNELTKRISMMLLVKAGTLVSNSTF